MSPTPGSRSELAPQSYRLHHYRTLALSLVAIAVLAPLLARGRADAFLVNQWLVYAIAGVGFYWIFGLAGRFAFCQTLMMATGAYVSARVVRELGPASFPLGIAAGTAAAAVLAGGIGAALRRTKEFYFAIATLAATEVGLLVFERSTGFTGPNGTVAGVDAPELFGHRFLADDEIFWLLLAALGLVLVVGVWIERSPLRRDAIAARGNDLVAATTGISTQRVQLGLFVLGSAAGGLSGALMAHWTGSIGVEGFGMQLAIAIFLLLLVGGVDSLWGPVVGAGFVVAIPRVLDSVERFQTIVYGAILLAVVILFPYGIVGGIRRLRARLAGPPLTPEASIASVAPAEAAGRSGAAGAGVVDDA